MGTKMNSKGKLGTFQVPRGRIRKGVVVQEARMGCGVAVVAARLQLGYWATHRKHFAKIKGDHERKGYTRQAIIDAFGHAGQKYKLHKFGPLQGWERRKLEDGLPGGSIVYVENDDIGHYLLKRSDGWMDSLKAPGVVRAMPSKPLSYLLDARAGS